LQKVISVHYNANDGMLKHQDARDAALKAAIAA
jgi:hypothetical protein